MNWQALIERLPAELDIPAGAARAAPVGGGDINQAYRLDVGARRLFVKTNRAGLLPMFEAERAGLDAIRRTRTVRAPEVYATGTEGERAFIVMEFIRMRGQPCAGRFAAALAAMHDHCAERFGFERDNTIGSTPQINGFSDDWVEFWRRHRLGFQLALGEQRGFDAGLLDAGARLNQLIDRFFAGYRPRASLLHGDLWSGNWAADPGGDAVIYDPACYFGDHEADLAMMELFGRPGDRFFAAYRERFPIDAGYPVRRELYNLYHIFNHALLFGGAYLSRTRQMIERLLASS